MSNQNRAQNNDSIQLSDETEPQIEELAIHIKNSFFEYKNNVTILDDLSLRIPKGKIFALLGPNGAGKTTLIRTILGRLQLKSGLIKVFATEPGSRCSDIPGKGVGYMPQELALFEEFSIEEILTYYGTLYHMSGKELIQRIDDLMKILNLPEKTRLINRLSGGQQRRVSIAITMIHRPKLIILDEPTVGVDSLLRHKIWNYLEECCLQNGQTVLITTHYIEEAKSAANVGFMSYGTILKQSDPQTLLNEYNCQTLESVFLQLCEQKKRDRKSIALSDIIHKNDQDDIEQESDRSNFDSQNELTSNKSFDFQRIKAMLIKYYILTVRRPAFLFIFYFLPILVLASLNYALGQYPAHISMVIYNEDQNPEFSQIIIDSIDKYHIDLKMASSNESAFESVVNGTNVMSVVFGKNFSDTFEYRLIDVLNISDEDLDESLIKVYIDFSNVPMAIFVLKYFLRAFNKFLKLKSDVLGQNSERFFHLVTVEEPIYGEFEFNLAEVFGPGILLVMTQLLSIILSSLQIVFDRKNSNLERILVSGVRPIEIFATHFIQYSVLIGVQVVITLCFAFGVFQNTQNGSYFDIYLSLFLIGMQGMSIGFFIALLIEEEVGIIAGIGLLILPLWLISGVFWPIEAIPDVLLGAVNLGPLCQPIQSIRSIMFRGWTLSHPGVYGGLLINLFYICFISFCDIILFTKLTK